jgi:heat shock protein HtpX
MGALLLLLGYFLGLYFFDSGIGGLIFALIIWVIMSLVAYFQGDNILLAMSRARKIGPDDHPRLYNVVEEMKIASGLEAMPSIYIVDDPAMNAFATGRDPQKASVTVTSGLLQKLNRDELQGVVGHEMAHIRNRDVLLMAMCSVLLGTIVILAWYGSRFMLFGGMGRTRRSSSSGGGGLGQIIIIVVAIVFMILAPLMAQLIYFAISRKREYLADASSALYTRYPEGLASALEKIAASTDQLKSANKATAPMYTVNPFRKQGRAAENLTSTHPPISERIRILRSMAGASYADYATAYRKVRDTSQILIPAAAVATVGAVPTRAAKPEELDHIQRARETTGALWNLNKYKIINCACGTRLRLPPNFRLPEIRCPHCGRINPV